MTNKDNEATCNEELEALNQAAAHFSLNSNDGALFLVAAQQGLERNNSRLLFDFLQDIENRQLLHFVGWDLLKVVFRFLPDENDAENDCENILVFICSTCSAREICLSLGEVLSCHLTWQNVVVLLRLLQMTCLRLVGKVARIFSTIFFELTKFLRNRENKYDHLVEILEITLEFLKPYVEMIQNHGQDTFEDTKELAVELESFLVHLLEFPFAELDFPAVSGIEARVTKCAHGCGDLCKFGGFSEIIVEFLGCLECNSFKNLLGYGIQQRKLVESLDDEHSPTLPYIGLGCLSFLVHVRHIGLDFIPAVLTGRYILETNAVYLNLMLCNHQMSVVAKGLQLLLAVLSLIDLESLEHVFCEETAKLAVHLTKLMTLCEDSDIRQQAVRALREMLNRFQRRGKYKHLRLLKQTCYHSGMAEFLILLLKEEIMKCLQEEADDEWFTGGNLAAFLCEVFCMPSKVFQSEYSLVEERSRILAALNLFRYLFIKDKENKTMIQTIAPELEGSFLKPLRDAASLSKAKFKESIKTKMDQIAGKVSVPKENEDEAFFSVSTPDGCELGKGSLQEQLEVLDIAVLAVDMIESLLIRIDEICEGQLGVIAERISGTSGK